MSDLSSQISAILSDPEAMRTIQNLSGMLGQSDTEPKEKQNNDQPESTSSFSGTSEILPTVMKFAPLLTAFREDDDSVRLLRAVKPFLSPARQERLEQAIRLLRIMRLIPLLRQNGIADLF